MMEYTLSTVNVKRSFPTPEGPYMALKGINMQAPRGKLTILKGRSGSGKTTLLNILGALDKPTGGKVLLEGRDIARLDEHRRTLLRRTKIGYVFQSVALVPMMTAAENVDYMLRIAKYKGSRAQRVAEVLRMVGLEKRMGHMPQELSGGEQQRVAIARAIAHKPMLLLADEPTGELDTMMGLQVVKIFKNLCQQEGVTIIMTTHDTGLMEIGDRVYELEDGEIIDGE